MCYFGGYQFQMISCAQLGLAVMISISEASTLLFGGSLSFSMRLSPPLINTSAFSFVYSDAAVNRQR